MKNKKALCRGESRNEVHLFFALYAIYDYNNIKSRFTKSRFNIIVSVFKEKIKRFCFQTSGPTVPARSFYLQAYTAGSPAGRKQIP